MGHFTHTLDFVAFPQSDRHAQAAAVGGGRHGVACGWSRVQVRKGVSNPEWGQKELIDRIGAVFCGLFRRIGNCHYPFDFTSILVLGSRELRSIVPECRKEVNLWGMEPADSVCVAFQGAVSRNLGSAPRRRSSTLAAPKVAEDGPIRTEDGGLSSEPPDDELCPRMMNLCVRRPRITCWLARTSLFWIRAWAEEQIRSVLLVLKTR